MLKTNRNILIIALIALVNMLGYGIIIPLLYGYSQKFGLTDFQNGLLFASYSVCQFLATPIIGRLSDKFGRRPMLLVSIAGTAASFFTMAFAPNATFLFIARMLDGITAGNIPVAFAVVSDSTKPEDRPRAFGMIGAAFSFGFVFGPAIAALTLNLGPAVPFLLAGGVTLIALGITAVYLPETNIYQKEVPAGKLFDFGKLWRTLFDPGVGPAFLISLIYFLAFSCAIIYGFQPFTLKILKLTSAQNAVIFTVFGATGLITQSFLIGKITKIFGERRAFISAIILTMSSLFAMYVSRSVVPFVAAMIFLSLSNSVSQTLIPAILSQQTDGKSQGSIMGLNASYQSIGMIVGPILGGIVATTFVPNAFLTGAVLMIICVYLSFKVFNRGPKKESAF